jgi:hypothetical protein
MFTQEVGYDPEIKLLTYKPMGVRYRVGDISELVGFYVPRISLSEGVRRALT